MRNFNNSYKILTGFLALVLVAGMASPAFAGMPIFDCGVTPSEVNIQIKSGGTFEFGTETNCSDNWSSGNGLGNTCVLNSVGLTGPPDINNPQISFSNIVTNLGDTSEEHCEQSWEFENSSGDVVIVTQELWINPPPDCTIDPTSAIVEISEIDGSGFVIKSVTCNFSIADFQIFENDCEPYEVYTVDIDIGNIVLTFTEQVTSFGTIDPQHCEVTFEVMGESGESIFVEQELWINAPEMTPVGGTVGSLDTMTLLVAGAQANMGLWSLALVGIVGAGVAITYKLKSKKTEQ